MDEFDEESDEAHDCKPDRCGHGDFLEFFSIWLGASFDEPNGILDELPAGLNELRYLIHGVWAVGTDQKQITLAASSAGHRSLLC